VGAGAIGLSISGLVAPHYKRFELFARGDSASAIKNQGSRLYLKKNKAEAVPIHVKVIDSVCHVSSDDIIVIAVKNYDLEHTAKTLRDQLGTHQPVVVALQNGVDNQQILPEYFARVIYGVVCYNAWRDGPGKVVYDKGGYIIIGTPANGLKIEQQEVQAIFRLGIDCDLTDRLEDAAHCKLVINLQNALMTLVGFQKRPIESYRLLVHMTTRLMWEGIQVLQAAGFKEHKLGNIPSWRVLKTAARLPKSVTGPLYKFFAKREGPNSMAQDMFGGKTVTEIESLNGYMLKLARKVGIPMPINQVVYDTAKERFGPDFQPISEIELWKNVQMRLKNS
jgi:2-dehydropantoate 2-reductase